MNSISHANNVAMARLGVREQSSLPDGKLKSCFARASCTHYGTFRFNMTGDAIGQHAGKRVAAFLKKCGHGYDTAAIGRLEGQSIAATLRKQERHVSFAQ